MDLITPVSQEVQVRFGKAARKFKVVNNPIPHIVVPTVKEVIHGWFYGYWDMGRRECSSERILINPYNGCSVNCPECYARGYRGYFDLWNESGIITVFKDIDVKLSEELDQLYVASTAYLCPVTDPFQQPLEDLYHLSEKTAHVFLDRGLPVDFITKRGGSIPNRLLERMAEHEYGHCLAQFSILSVDDELRKVFSPGGSSVEEQFRAVRRCADLGIYAIVRMDPIMPGITDSEGSIEQLVERAKIEGARHLIFSVCDLGDPWRDRLLRVIREHYPEAYLTWLKLFKERIGNSFSADINYRRSTFSLARKICEKYGVTMSLCMEFEVVREGRRVRYRGLNECFMTSKVCEGMETPMYYRKSLKEGFRPFGKCNGDCLGCARGSSRPVCPAPLLHKAPALRFSDYKRLRFHFAEDLCKWAK